MKALWTAPALFVIAVLLQVGNVVSFGWPVWALLGLALASSAAVAVATRK